MWGKTHPWTPLWLSSAHTVLWPEGGAQVTSFQTSPSVKRSVFSLCVSVCQSVPVFLLFVPPSGSSVLNWFCFAGHCRTRAFPDSDAELLPRCPGSHPGWVRYGCHDLWNTSLCVSVCVCSLRPRFRPLVVKKMWWFFILWPTHTHKCALLLLSLWKLVYSLKPESSYGRACTLCIWTHTQELSETS